MLLNKDAPERGGVHCWAVRFPAFVVSALDSVLDQLTIQHDGFDRGT